MAFAISAFELLRIGHFPKFQECRDRHEEFNPYSCNFFVSHRWLSREVADDGRFFNHFVTCLFRIINNCIFEKFLDEGFEFNAILDREYIHSRALGNDLYQHILDPTEEEYDVIYRYLDQQKLPKPNAVRIMSHLLDYQVWFDWTCMPQLPRTPDEDALFREGLKKMHWMLENSLTICFWDGSEFYRGWCIVEVLIALRLKTLAYYWTEDPNPFILKERQVIPQSKRQSNGLFPTGGNPLLLAQQAKKQAAHLFSLAAMPEFIPQLANLIDKEQVSAIFSTNNVKCSYSDDIGKVIDIFIDYNKKYQGYTPFSIQSKVSSRVPLDFQTKLLNRLRALYEGGKQILNPVQVDYVKFPIIQYSPEKHRAFIEENKNSPFFRSPMLTYSPRPIRSNDPIAIILAYFQVEDVFGFITNTDIELVDMLTGPLTAEDLKEEFAPTVMVEKIRSNYDYNLSLAKDNTLQNVLSYQTIVSNIIYYSFLKKVGSFFPTIKNRVFRLVGNFQMIGYYTDSTCKKMKGSFRVQDIQRVGRLQPDNWFIWYMKNDVHGGQFKLQCESPEDYEQWNRVLRQCGVAEFES